MHSFHFRFENPSTATWEDINMTLISHGFRRAGPYPSSPSESITDKFHPNFFLSFQPF
jgi:hypothetical protein